VANKTKQAERDRRAKIEAMRQAERARERRKSMLFIAVAAVVGLGLIAAAGVPAYLNSRNDPANKPLSDFGVAAAEANCDSVVTEPATGNNQHEQDGTRLEYAQVPPSSGPHWGQPAFPAREFYTARNRPALEQLLHNMEHGYTVMWYDETLTGDRLDTLRNIAASAREKDPTAGKFIVSAWDDSYGAFPSGTQIALSHWGAQEGARQLCGKISGEAVQRFIERFPASDSPEPTAG